MCLVTFSFLYSAPNSNQSRYFTWHSHLVHISSSGSKRCAWRRLSLFFSPISKLKGRLNETFDFGSFRVFIFQIDFIILTPFNVDAVFRLDRLNFAIFVFLPDDGRLRVNFRIYLYKNTTMILWKLPVDGYYNIGFIFIHIQLIYSINFFFATKSIFFIIFSNSDTTEYYECTLKMSSLIIV